MKRIDVLPDDVLLEIFDFYGGPSSTSLVYGVHSRAETEAWQSLVHVCRRWRSLVFGSPRRMNLRLWCTPKTPAKDTLFIWPALPLIVGPGGNTDSSSGTDNIIAALGQSNRVCQVFLRLPGWQLEEVLAAMHVPFPELTDLQLSLYDENPPVRVIPDSFLDGSAPRLQNFLMSGILFPGFPKLILSATHLVYLGLFDIPHSGYISPEAMVALLSVLSSLEDLSLHFRSPQPRPDLESRRLPSPKRSTLPALYFIYFRGVTEYLEELVTRIDTPQLQYMHITFFNQIDFDIPRLAQFINCTPTLSPRALDEAHVQFNDTTAIVKFRHWASPPSHLENLRINVSCREPDWQLSSIEQVCNSSLHPLFMAEDLYIEHQYSELVWKDGAIDNTLWLQLLLPFTAVKNLYLSKQFASGIAAALQELARGGITEVLPSLQNILVEGLEPSGSLREDIGQFVTARQLSGHPVAISEWVKDSAIESM